MQIAKVNMELYSDFVLFLQDAIGNDLKEYIKKNGSKEFKIEKKVTREMVVNYKRSSGKISLSYDTCIRRITTEIRNVATSDSTSYTPNQSKLDVRYSKKTIYMNHTAASLLSQKLDSN